MMRFVVLYFILFVLKNNLSAQELEYNKDIAPIIFQHCTPCHQKKEVGPFPLTEYKDIFMRLKQIDFVVSNRIMPPWKADPAYRHFQNENVLTTEQIANIQKWIKDGAKISSKELKYQADALASKENLLINDDYIEVKIPKEYTIEATNDDWVVQFIVPVELDEAKSVSNILFMPDNRKAIHHANFKIVRYDENLYKNRIKPFITTYPHDNPMDDKYDEPFNVKDIIYYGGWLPGASPMKWNEGYGFEIPKKIYVQFKIHYAPTAIRQKDHSALRIYFTKKPIRHTVKFINIGSFGGVAEPYPLLVLSPDSVQRFSASYKIDFDMNMVYCVPHMHLLGKDFIAYAVTPSNDTIPIIRINEWDFNWQEFYKLTSDLLIPKGSTITITGTFDNRSSNINNHFNPPKWIVQGVSTYSEMLSMVMLYYDN